MSFIQENILRINLGLSKEYTMIQFNDVHAVSFDKNRDDFEAIDKAIAQERLWMKQRLDFAEKFKETYDSKNMLSSTDCLNRLIEYANDNQPDLVILAGDIIDYYSDTNHEFLKKSIKRLKSQYLFSCGNHESPPKLFQDICQGNCDFNYIDLREFVVVSINNSTRKIKPSQLESLEKLLTYKKPLILVMHIPIMTEYNLADFMKLDPYYSMKYNDCDEVTQDFINLVSSSHEVRAILCGHTHGSIASFIAPNIPQYCCSSALIGHINKIVVK